MPRRVDAKIRIVVYADTDLNLIDGSSVWTQSVALALADIPRVRVTLLLKAPVQNDRLTSPLASHPDIDLVDAFARRLLPDLSNTLSPHQAATILVKDDEFHDRYDSVLVRGSRVAKRFSDEPSLHGIIWTYLTDIPQHILELRSTTEASPRLVLPSKK